MPVAPDGVAFPPRGRPTKERAAQKVIAGLPGDNPYDDAVVNRGFSYAEAKQREEVALVNEKIRQAKLATASTEIALEKERLALQEQKGSLIGRQSYLEKQEAIASTFKELVHLIVSECVVTLPANMRESFSERIEAKTNAAFTAIAQSVVKGLPRDAIIQALYDAFKTEAE